MSSKFRMIACSDREVYALDENGRAWKYVPSRAPTPHQEQRFAFWTQLTNHRAGGDIHAKDSIHQ